MGFCPRLFHALRSRSGRATNLDVSNPTARSIVTIRGVALPVFKTGAIGRSATPPESEPSGRKTLRLVTKNNCPLHWPALANHTGCKNQGKGSHALPWAGAIPLFRPLRGSRLGGPSARTFGFFFGCVKRGAGKPFLDPYIFMNPTVRVRWIPGNSPKLGNHSCPG